MDSLSKLKLGADRIMNTEGWDYETKINMVYSDLKYWSEQFQSLDKNIKETSISKSHEFERIESTVKSIFNL